MGVAADEVGMTQLCISWRMAWVKQSINS